MGRKKRLKGCKRIWLSVYRETLEYSQSELAKEIEVSQATINYYELGDRTPSEENAEKIGHLLGFDKNMFYKKGVI